MKRKIILLLTAFVLSSANLYSQIGFDFSGYAVDLPVYQSVKDQIAGVFGLDKNQILNLTRFRLRPTLYLGDNSRINLEYELTSLYFNSLNLFSLANSGKTNRQIADLTWNPVNEKNFSITHFIDRLYFKQDFSFGEIVVGRQRISWGTGRIWNPTDLFNPINPTMFYKTEKDGADAVSMKLFIGNFTDLNLVFNPGQKISDSNYGARFRTNIAEYDISFIGGRFDKRIVVGMDFAGNLLETGLRGEGIISADESDISNNFIKFILGADYQFTPELYTLIEYQFNGEGKNDKSDYEFLRLLSGEILNLNKNYIVISGFYQLTPLFAINITKNFNLNDKSGFASFVGNYSVTQDFYLSLGGQLFYGGDFTEYWYYPNSIYLQGEYYF